MVPILLALLPVIVFLVVLLLVDSFKLVPTTTLVKALLAGALAALLAGLLHQWIAAGGMSPQTLARYVAPVVEESLKTAFVFYFLSRRQIGFLVDAAIVGFAIGAGFAVVENLDYLRHIDGGSYLLWSVRGFGTAVLHATTTAIVGMVAKALLDRSPDRGWWAVLPGLLAAVLLHALYNHALVSPVLAAALLVVGMPLTVLAVFSRSEHMTREWVGEGLDLDVELLTLVRTPQFSGTRLGRYLHELRARFPGPVVADMFCLLQLDLELAIRAKGMLMAREAGLELPGDDTLTARLAERDYLERSIGRTGLMALRPLQVTGDRDRWHKYLLEQAGGRRSRTSGS